VKLQEGFLHPFIGLPEVESDDLGHVDAVVLVVKEVAEKSFGHRSPSRLGRGTLHPTTDTGGVSGGDYGSSSTEERCGDGDDNSGEDSG